MNEYIRRIFVVVLLLVCVLPVFAQSGVPTVSEEVVVGLHPFNGRDYLQATFSHSDRDTVYLLADSDNFLRVVKTFVYFWPLTSEWRTDTDQLDYTFEGYLVLTDIDGARRVLEPTRYTYFSVPGQFEGEVRWRVEVGDDAETLISELRRLINEYSLEQQDRVRQAASLQDQFNAVLAEITRARENDEEIASLVAIAEQIDAEIRALRRPGPRPWEDLYDTPPRRVDRGFIVNLPVGRYRIHFENADGDILEDSEKHMFVFDSRREGAVGFELLPGDTYTRPIVSSEPESVIYIDGSTEFYVKSFVQNEYNDLYYKKMVDQDAQGNDNIHTWVRIYELNDPVARIGLGSGDDLELEAANYLVRQTPGTSLGYTIRRIERTDVIAEERPTFRGIRIDPAHVQKSGVLTVPGNGSIRDGVRYIRVIDTDVSQLVLSLLVLFPLVVFFIFKGKRKRFLISHGR